MNANDNRTLTQSLTASLAATACRTQPSLNFVHGGTLCQKCGRQVPVACERAWLNTPWEENLTDEEFATRQRALGVGGEEE